MKRFKIGWFGIVIEYRPYKILIGVVYKLPQPKRVLFIVDIGYAYPVNMFNPNKKEWFHGLMVNKEIK